MFVLEVFLEFIVVSKSAGAIQKNTKHSLRCPKADNTYNNNIPRRSMFKRLAVQVCPRAPFLVPRSVLQGLRPASRCLHVKKKVSGRERFKKFTAPAQQNSAIRTIHPQLDVCACYLSIDYLPTDIKSSHSMRLWIETIGLTSSLFILKFHLPFFRTTTLSG